MIGECCVDVGSGEVQADIVAAREQWRVGSRAACKVEHGTKRGKVIVVPNRRELGTYERSLPGPIDTRVLHDERKPLEYTHGWEVCLV